MADRKQPSDIDRLSEAMTSLQKSLECTICLELMTEPTKTRCGHSFCKVCIGSILRKKSASCPLCKKSLNRRNISKDDHLQTCIEKFKKLVTAAEMDSHIDILSHSKQPRDTKESCSYLDARQSSRDCNTEKPSKKERSIRQLNQSANWQTDKPSTSCGTKIDCDNPRYDLNMPEEKFETLSNPSHARTCPGEENDNAIHSTVDIKIRTWLHSFPDERNADDLKVEIQPIEDRAGPMNSISDDNGKSDETGEVYRGTSRRPSQDRKRSTDCPERVDEDGTLSQVDKGAKQIGKVIEIDSAASGLKYNASHVRIRTKERREKDTRSISDIEKTVNQRNSSTTVYDQAQIAASAPSSLSMTNTSTITEQSIANWSSVIEFGKEMKRSRKGKVKKLNVSTEKKKSLPRVVEDVKLSPNSRYNSDRIAPSYNKSDKEADVSNQLEESNGRKQDAIDKSLDLLEAKMKALNETNSQSESFDKDKFVASLKSSSTYPTMNTSYITLEEGRRIRIINLNNEQMNKIIGLEDVMEDLQNSQNQDHERNVADCRDSLLSPRNRLTVLTPEKLNESIHEREIIRDILQTSAVNLGSSSCLLAEKQTPGRPRETNNVPGTSSGAISSQLQSSTPNKARLSLNRKSSANKSTDSPLLSQLPLSYRLPSDKHEQDIGNRRSIDSPKDSELCNRFKVVKRDLSFNIHENQREIDRKTVPNACLKSIIEVEDNDGNVSEIVRQDKKNDRNFAAKSTLSKKSISTKSKSVKTQGHGSVVKFMQLGALIRRNNVKYCFLGATKHEQSMRAEVLITPICNMQVSRSEMHVATSDPWNDSQSPNNIIVMKNNCFANNANSNQTISKEFSPALSFCEISATSTPEKDSHLNQKKSSTIVCSSTNANQKSDRSIKNIAEKDARSLHRMPRADKSTIHGTISRAHPGTSNSIKLLSPDKDSQLKFLEIDSPMSEHGELRRASSMKTAIKGNNFSEMESSRLAASTLSKADELFIKSSRKKRKRMKYVNYNELLEDESSDINDDSSDSASDSSRSTIKLGNELSKKAGPSRLDANKKRRLSSPNDQAVEVIPSVSKEQDASRRKSKMIYMSGSDTDTESMTHVKLKSNNQCAQRNASITNTTTNKYPARQDLDEDLRIQNIIDKWSNEHNATRKTLTKESKNSQSSIKSMKNPSEENPTSHQSSHSTNAPKMEKRKNTKSSQKSSARESDMFESNSLFNSENLDYILQPPTRLNANDTSKKIVNSSNDDIINRVLQIDRSQNNANACQPLDSAPWNDITSQKEKNSREYLLQDNFDEIIASVEQPQSVDYIPCTEQPDRNANRSLAKQKTSNCLAMTDESFAAVKETPILPASSMNDIFEYFSPRNIRKLPTTNAISRNSDKENVVCNQKRHSYVSDQRDRKDGTTNADVIDKDSRKKIVSKHDVSREKEKFLEECNTSIQSASRLHVNDDEMQITTTSNESNLKNNTFEHDSLMNITQHQVQLQMFEEDLFGIAATRNQTKTTKTISRDSPSQKEQRTPRKRKQNIQDKNKEPEEYSADEDDVVENTPEKKKNSGNNAKTLESRDSTKIAFLSPISKTIERIPSTSGTCQMIRPLLGTRASTPTNLLGMRPFSQSTPIIAQNSMTISRPDVGGNKRTERIESGSILLARQVDAKTPENVRRLPDKRNLCFVCSGLSMVQITTVKEFAAKYNTNYVNQFDRDVTHVIVNTTGEQNAAKSTLKYLQGIAHRKWIVSYRWIEDCIKQQKLLDEVPYEATTHSDVGINGAGPRNSRLRDKDLFEGFTFLCVGPYDNVSLFQYQDLLLAAGATVVDSFEMLAKMGGMKGVLIQDNVHDDKVIEHWYRTAKAAPILVDWIVECIGQYKLFKLTPYILCLSPQDFCAIGYSRELVEEDEEYSDDE